MATTITAARTNVLVTDVDNDGVADFGDTIRTTLLVTNTGAENATNVTINDPNDGLTITNIAPVAVGDFFTAVGNTVLRVGGAANIGSGPSSVVAGNVLSNDFDIGAGSNSFTLTAVSGGTTAQGGTFNLNADGSFNYVNQAGDTGIDSFTYTITDGSGLSSTGRVTITLTGEVWYVDAAAGAGGTGTSANPFNTMALLNNAGSDVDGTGDTIYVTGAATGPIVLEASQQLVGTGSALTVAGFTLATAGTNSSVTSSTGPVVTLGTDNVLSGIDITGTGSAAGLAGSSFGALTVSGVGVATATGQILSLSTGTVAAAGVSFTSLSSTGVATGNAVSLGNVDSNVFSVGSVSIAGAQSSGINIFNTSSATFNFGAATIGIGGATVGQSGIQLSDSSANVTFTSVDFDNMNARGVFSSNMTGSLTINGGTIGAQNDPNVQGVLIDGGTGAVTIAASITKTTAGNIVEVNNHETGNVTFSGNLSATGGVANGILVTASNSGTVTFSGATKTINTGANTAVNLTNNTGSTINLTGGGLDIDTTTGVGFNATGGGTVSVQGSGNTIDATSGTALNIVSTNIGVGHVTFQRISSGTAATDSSSATGIILDTTGLAGGLHVTGTGSAGSGGTIQEKTGADGVTSQGIGIYLNSTSDVQLASMNLHDFQNYAIRGLNVNGFTLSNSVINAATGTNGTNVGIDEGSVIFGNLAGTTGLTGTVTITNTRIDDGVEDGLRIANSSGTVTATITGSSFNDNGNDGIFLTSTGGSGATVNASVNNSTFNNNIGDHFQATAEGNGNLHTQFGNSSANTLTTSSVAVLGGSVVTGTGAAWSGSGSTNISNNTITGAKDTPININVGGTGTFTAIVNGNTIGANGVVGSGTSANEDAIRIIANGDAAVDATPDGGTLTAAITNNLIQNVSGRGIFVLARDGGTASDRITINVTITGNTLRQSPDSGGQGIRVEAGATAADWVRVHADIGGAGGLANIFADDWGTNLPAGIDFDEIRVFDGAGDSQFVLRDISTPITLASIGAYLAGRNTLGAGGVASGAGTLASYSTGGAPPQPLLASFTITSPVDPQGTEPGVDSGLGEDGRLVPGDGGETPADAGPVAPTQPVVVDDGVLSASELGLLVEAAIARWAAAGASEAQLAAMRAVKLGVADLGGLYLGESRAGSITLDDNAAGFSWFIDATPGDDVEFTGAGTRLFGLPDTAAGARIDLLTAVMHELGHQIGLHDDYDAEDSNALMYGFIGMGERRSPGAGDADDGATTPVESAAFALAPVNIGTLAPGQAFTLTWTSTVDTVPNNQVIPFIQTQSTVSGGNFTTVTSNLSTLNIDGLNLSGRVFNDADRDGVQDAGEATINSVAVELYADDGTTAGVYDASDTLLQTSAGAGFNFIGLAPGEYIALVKATNFTGGNPLVGRFNSPGEADPDDNSDTDDNGVRMAGFVVSKAITLAYNTETVNDGSANGGKLDINDTVDFGFYLPNVAATSGSLTTDAAGYTEQQAQAALLDVGSNATLADTDSLDFAGGSLTVSITTGLAAAEDQLVIRLTGAVSFNATAVFVNAVQIATYTGAGAGGGPLVFSFNADATPARVQELVRAISYTNSGGDAPTAGSRTITWTLDDGDGTADGGVATLVVTSSVTVTAVDDLPTAVADSGAAFANAAANITVVTNDTDPDAGPKTVGTLSGTAVVVDQVVTLTSGATVKLNADGTIAYNPNGQYNALISPATATATGAAIGPGFTTATDSFTYALNGGSQATVTVTITGVDGPGDRLNGTGGNNSITGTGGVDYIDVSQGGQDTANGGDSNDVLFFGAQFGTGDVANGGNGMNDQLGLQGTYGAGTTLSGSQITNTEVIVALPGFSYNLTTTDDLVAAGTTMTLYASGLTAGQTLTFNGTAETDGSFLVLGGAGTDIIATGAQNDAIYFGPGRFDAANDVVNGGAGTNDQLGLDGSFTGTLSGVRIQNIEVIALLAGGPGGTATYDITLANDLTGAGQTLSVWAPNVNGVVTINGSAETDGNLMIYGGRVNDSLTGGSGNDFIWGNTGSDSLTGGGGADTYYFSTALGADVDTIIGFVSGSDVIRLEDTVFAALTPGGIAPSAFVIGTAATTAQHRIIYNNATGALLYDADGVGGAAAVQFATLAGNPALVNTDFLVT